MSDIIKMSKKCSNINTSLKNIPSQKSSEQSEKEKLALVIQLEYQKGFSEGERTLRVQLENDYEKKVQTKYDELNNFMQRINDKLIEYETQIEKIVLNASFILAEKILKREMEKQSIIKEILDDSLQRVIGANEIIVRLHPQDFEQILLEDKNYNSGSNFSKIRFEKDDRIEIGGCFIESDIGNADGRISSQLNELKKNFNLDEN